MLEIVILLYQTKSFALFALCFSYVSLRSCSVGALLWVIVCHSFDLDTWHRNEDLTLCDKPVWFFWYTRWNIDIFEQLWRHIYFQGLHKLLIGQKESMSVCPIVELSTAVESTRWETFAHASLQALPCSPSYSRRLGSLMYT